MDLKNIVFYLSVILFSADVLICNVYCNITSFTITYLEFYRLINFQLIICFIFTKSEVVFITFLINYKPKKSFRGNFLYFSTNDGGIFYYYG